MFNTDGSGTTAVRWANKHPLALTYLNSLNGQIDVGAPDSNREYYDPMGGRPSVASDSRTRIHAAAETSHARCRTAEGRPESHSARYLAGGNHTRQVDRLLCSSDHPRPAPCFAGVGR